jgi:septum formation topological specificity factor MinE
VVCSTTLSVSQTALRHMVGRLVNNELERVWKEVVKVLSQYLSGCNEEVHVNLSQDSRLSDRDLNPRPP